MWTVLNSVLSTVLLGEARDLDKQPQCIPSFMDCTSCSTVTIKQVKKRKEYSPRTLPFLQVGAGQDCRTGFIDSKTGGKQTRTRGASTCQRLLSTNKNFYGTCADKMPFCCTFDVQRYLQPSRKFLTEVAWARLSPLLCCGDCQGCEHSLPQCLSFFFAVAKNDGLLDETRS